jgi:hypothetical protein
MSSTARRKASRLLAAAASAILFGLNTHHVHAETTPPPKFTSAHVASVELTLVGDDALDEHNIEDKKPLDARAPSIIKKSLQNEGLQIVEDGTQPAAPGQVNIRVTAKYDPGNRAIRWVSGPFFAKGRGKIDVHIEANDPASGKVLTATDVQYMTGRFGLTGGDFYKLADSALEDAATELAGQLQELE